MRNCNNCGGPPSIHHNGCDYCGTNVPIKRRVTYVDLGNMPRSKAQKLLDYFWVRSIWKDIANIVSNN